MTQSGKLDVAGMLTEVGVDASSANPADSVGNTQLIRTARNTGELPVIRQGVGADLVTLGQMIGEGSLSAVYLGEQRTMRRQIAVRTVHPIRRTPNSPAQILSGAWMQGALENPHVIPIYGVGRGIDDMPLVLMKAVRATPWSDILEKPGHRLGCPKNGDPIEFNIQRILKVCVALDHAHSRGIIHRDVKPENVLIGSGGSVYVDGWELAVSVVPDESGRFPLAAEQTQIAGTPSYMPPELATRNAAAVGARTDVYLVGATLHEVLTGTPRHTGENVFDAIFSAAASTPVDYDPEVVPPELAGVLNKAMAGSPENRYPSIAALSEALQTVLRHHPAVKLVKQAQRAHAEFSRAIQERQDDFIVRELFATTFTAYNSARQFWSRDPDANEGLEAAQEEMIAYELEHGSRARARDLLGRLTSPSVELERELAKPDPNPTPAPAPAPPQADAAAPAAPESPEQRRDRVTLMVAVVASWSLFGFFFGALEMAGFEVKVWMLVVAASAIWLLLGGLLVTRQALFNALMSRYVLGPFGTIVVGSAAIQLTAPSGLGPHELVVEHFFLFFIAMAIMNALIDWRMVVGTSAYFAAMLAGHAAPEMAFWLMGGANFLALGSSGYIIHQHLIADER